MNFPPVNERGSIRDEDIPPGLAPGLYAHDWLPATLPRSWEVVSSCPNGRRYRLASHGLSVIASGWQTTGVGVANLTIPWMHVSVGRKSSKGQLPTMKNVLLVRNVLFGVGECVAVLPDFLQLRAQAERGLTVIHLYGRADGGHVIDVPDLLRR